MEGPMYISNYAVLANSDCGEMPEKSLCLSKVINSVAVFYQFCLLAKENQTVYLSVMDTFGNHVFQKEFTAGWLLTEQSCIKQCKFFHLLFNKQFNYNFHPKEYPKPTDRGLQLQQSRAPVLTTETPVMILQKS